MVGIGKQSQYSEQQLREFLVRAKKATFAGSGERQKGVVPGSKEYVYKESDFMYQDRYFGSVRDLGQEIVWYGEIPIWGMNYMGGMLSGFEEQSVDAFTFLKRALLLVTPETPFRGPTELHENEWVYQMQFTGSFYEFDGRETVKRNELVIYQRRFFGGSIHHKRTL